MFHLKQVGVLLGHSFLRVGTRHRSTRLIGHYGSQPSLYISLNCINPLCPSLMMKNKINVCLFHCILQINFSLHIGMKKAPPYTLGVRDACGTFKPSFEGGYGIVQGKNRVIVLALSLFRPSPLCGCGWRSAPVSGNVVVIGAGGAGMTAAIEALDAGASVIILEKCPWWRNTAQAWCLNVAAGSASQKAAGIEDSPEVMIQDTMKGGKEKNDPALVRYLAEHSAAAIGLADRHWP